MRDSVSRTLIAFVLVQALFVILLPLAIVASAQGLDVSVYSIAFEEKYRLLAQTEVATVLLFTLAIWAQRRWWLTGFLTSVPLIGLSVVLGVGPSAETEAIYRTLPKDEAFCGG